MHYPNNYWMNVKVEYCEHLKLILLCNVCNFRMRLTYENHQRALCNSNGFCHLTQIITNDVPFIIYNILLFVLFLLVALTIIYF